MSERRLKRLARHAARRSADEALAGLTPDPVLAAELGEVALYRRGSDGGPTFVEVPAPTDEALPTVLHKIIT